MNAFADIPADMQSAIENFDRSSEDLANKFGKELEGKPVPPRIYHYTTDIGLRGILESGSFWLTDIFNLNDPSELKHSVSNAAKILRELAKSPTEQFFAERMSDYLDQGLKAAAHFFVLAFSTSDDDLGQWRAYADDGRGFVLEFEAASIETAFAKDELGQIRGNLTFPITYSDETLKQLYRDLIELALPLTNLPQNRGLNSEQIAKYFVHISALFAVQVIRRSIYFKHEAYSNEAEYRFLQIYRGDEAAPGVKYRQRPYSLVRFKEFDWKLRAAPALKRIIIGPAADLERSTAFANECLRAFHIGTVEIDQSKIPYRVAR